MSILSERLAELPEFIDYRQDQLLDILRAISTLNNTNTDDPDEMISIIRGLDLPRLHTAYNSKCHETRYGNSSLQRTLRNVSFHPFKALIGADDYV